MLYRRGNVWWYEFSFVGQRVRESSHSASRTVAREAERQRRRDLEESVNGLKDKRRRPLLFSVAAREYLDWKKGDIKASTYRIESKSIDHLLPVFGKLLLADIDGQDITRYQQARSAEGAAGATINLEVGTLRSILRRHRLWGQVQPDVKKRPERDDVGHSLTPDEETRLLDACRQSRSRALYPAVILAVNSGLADDAALTVNVQVIVQSDAFPIASLPIGARWLHMLGVSLLAGIGFTMSLFIGSLSFADLSLMNDVRLGVLVASLVAAVSGYLVLRAAGPGEG